MRSVHEKQITDYPDDRSSKIIQNVCNYVPVSTASYPRSLKYASAEPFFPKKNFESGLQVYVISADTSNKYLDTNAKLQTYTERSFKLFNIPNDQTAKIK